MKNLKRFITNFTRKMVSLAQTNEFLISRLHKGRSAIDSALTKEVKNLYQQTRYRSAMEMVLKRLATHPTEQNTFTLASIILDAYIGRDAHQAQEPLTKQQMIDTRLDKLFCQCEMCGSVWAPNAILTRSSFNFSEAYTWGSAGGSCPNCHRTLCTDCARDMNDPGFPKCPNCKQNLEPISIPNGREPIQLQRRLQKVQYAIILREGPIPLTDHFVNEFFLEMSPDVIEDNARIAAFSIQEWPATPESLMELAMKQFIAWGILPPQDAVDEHPLQSKDRMRLLILKVYSSTSIGQTLQFHNREHALKSRYAGNLRCAYCGQVNRSEYWPRNGDLAEFYFNTREDVVQRPGLYRIAITCPYCYQDWYVVWDRNPA